MVFESVKIEGTLLSPDLLEEVAGGSIRGQSPQDFHVERGARLTDEIARAWSVARAHWEAFKRSLERVESGAPRSATATTETRRHWVEPLLELLGYEELTWMKSAEEIGGRTYFISHRAGTSSGARAGTSGKHRASERRKHRTGTSREHRTRTGGEHRPGTTTDHPPVHIVGALQELDRRPVSGTPRLSPHALVQEYLNRTEHLWGVVTNGLQLRLLRDSALMSRPAYIEFNLEEMFNGEKFAEFALFYRLVHRTRLPRTREDVHECLLEEYFQQSLEQGGRVRENLRIGVEKALKILGNGFLRHPSNVGLTSEIESGSLTATAYYRELLRLIYRLLFLMVSEERKLVGPDGEAGKIYESHYSVTRLRKLAARRPGFEKRHCDLWEGLLRSLILHSDPKAGEPLGIKPLGGDLFNGYGEASSCQRFIYSSRLSNRDLLSAVRELSIYTMNGGARRINYAALDVEELGSVYESLLDYQPALRTRDGGVEFELLTGTERKTTGSYYTRPDLVGQLIKSALEPVIRERLEGLRDAGEKERALLSIKVCDPACGSGHFLLAAARRIGRELASVRSGEEHPSPSEFRRAVRDVINHCVYGVDLNPLAVDLCKLALWLEGHNKGMPLSFLDNHIKCGNSLVGVLDMEVLEEGIPDEAFKPVTGDESEAARLLKKRNREAREQRDQYVLEFGRRISSDLGEMARKHEEIEMIDEKSTEDVKRKEELFTKLHSQDTQWWRDWTACNIWTYAFFARKTDGLDETIPTTDRLNGYMEQSGSVTERLAARANGYAHEKRFFHWPLEFPEVFERGGFDVVLGNPPWERIKLQEKEFFATRNIDIARARNKAERERLIRELKKSDRQLYGEFEEAKHFAESSSRFLRGSSRFEFTSRGDINTYAVFTELASGILNPLGRAGILIPTGIATDDTCSRFFGHLVESAALLSLYDFENRKRLFPDVDSRYKFCLFTVRSSGGRAGEKAPSPDRSTMEFAFFLHEVRELDAQPGGVPAGEKRRIRTFSLRKEDLGLLNPNTKTCPIFRTSTDAELTKKIYSKVPVLVNGKRDENPWGISFLRMLDMSNDSHLFRTSPGEGLLPLYEAKMIHQYDHRWGTYEMQKGKPVIRDVSPDEKKDPDFTVTPRYWVAADEVEARLRGKWERRWLVGFRDITNATNERTSIFSVLPRVGVGNNTPVLCFSEKIRGNDVACFVGDLSSFALDYVARQKIAGTHMNFFYVEQLPVLPPDAYNQRDIDFILPRVIELVYTARDLKPFAEDMGYEGDPFPWNEERRAILKAELDAYYAKLYGLSREELNYILDPHDVMGEDFPGETFRVLEKNEVKKHGRYRTKELVLEAWDRLWGSGA